MTRKVKGKSVRSKVIKSGWEYEGKKRVKRGEN